MEPNEWLVILNPVSGRGQALRHQAQIVHLLNQQGMHHSVALSRFHGHTIGLVSAALAAGCRRLLVAGGDGSLNEAVNGILAQNEVAATDILLANLPVGTGNDWARSHKVPSNWPGAVALAASEASAVHDAGLAEFGDGSRRWFINVAGVGFDAAVVERKMARGFGPLAYMTGLLGALWSYRPLPVRVSLDQGLPRDAHIFVHFAALGKHCGGGMLIAPEAAPDDGRLHSVLINAMSRLEVLANLKRLFDGTLPSHPKVEAGTCTTIDVAAPTALGVEADGELIGHTPVTFRVLPRAIRVVVPPLA
ncbi:MAG: diacylglycerol kinase family lipid kinase [Burkholderiaceae bacterium]|nr:diacylglycerol kinase family lipid kinase [Burkholderiaceae bacterium]